MAGSSRSNRKDGSLEDSHLRFIGTVLRDEDPFYYLCECAHIWASIAGLKAEYLYEVSRKGTDFESIPFHTFTHKQWNRLGLNIRKSNIKTAMSRA